MSKKTEIDPKEQEKDIQQEEEINETTSAETSEEAEEPAEKKRKKKKKLSKAEELKEQQYKYAELNDKYMRLFSEFDNFRKRTNKEKIDLINTASEGVITAMLPVLDDFDRALQAFKEQNVDDTTSGRS